MVSISLYRGELHRVPAGGRPRQWLLPPRAVSPRHFKMLQEKRSLALSRLTSDTAQAVKEKDEEEEETIEKEQEGVERHEKVAQLDSEASGCPSMTNSEKQDETTEGSDPQAQESGKIEDVSGSNFIKKEVSVVNFEVSNDLNSASDKEVRKRELESKLLVLNDKKHDLVQLLKQILNAEEEIKRRNMQSSGIRASVPIQTDVVVELGSTSVSGLPPKLSVEVNFGGDSGGESDVAGSSNNTGRQLHQVHNISPSAPSLQRPPPSPFSSFQNNSVCALHMSRANLTAIGLGSTTSSSALTSTSNSPSRLAGPVSPFPLTNTHYIASSPSPVASGGASSVFRDRNLSSPAPDRYKTPFS